MDVSGLQERLASRGLEPVYLVYGPEDFLRGEAVKLIRAKAAQGKEPCDTAEFNAQEDAPARLFDDLRTQSLFAPRRLVLVEDAGLLFTQALEPLAEYVARPSPKTTLVLVAEALSKSGRKKSPKARAAQAAPAGAGKESLLRKVVAVECPIIAQKNLSAWCAARVRALGKQIEPPALKLLAELAGTNLGQLDGQIRNLVALAKGRPKITAKDVSNLVSADHAWRTYELTNEIMKRSAPTALRMLDGMLRDADAPGMILVQMGRDIRKFIVVKELARRGLKPAEIAQRSGVPDWLVRKNLDAARGVSVEELKSHLHRILEADLDCKTGGGRRERWILERLVLQLCGPQESPR